MTDHIDGGAEQPASPHEPADLDHQPGRARIESDDGIEDDGSDPHLPASEADLLKEDDAGDRGGSGLTPPPPD